MKASAQSFCVLAQSRKPDIFSMIFDAGNRGFLRAQLPGYFFLSDSELLSCLTKDKTNAKILITDFEALREVCTFLLSFRDILFQINQLFFFR